MMSRRIYFLIFLFFSVVCYGLDTSKGVPMACSFHAVRDVHGTQVGLEQDVLPLEFYTAEQRYLLSQLNAAISSRLGARVGDAGRGLHRPEISSALQDYYGSPECVARYIACVQHRQFQQEQEVQRQSEEKKQADSVAQEKADRADQAHKEKYGVSYETLHGGRNVKGWYQSRDYDKVKDFILLSPKKLTRMQALNIWDGYCDNRFMDGGKKAKGRVCIITEYDHRERQPRLEKKALEQARPERAAKAVAAQKIVLRQQAEKDAALAQVKQNEDDEVNAKSFDIEEQFVKSHKECACCVKLPRDLEFLRSEYGNVPIFDDDSMSAEQHERVQQREQALTQTKLENYEQYDKAYCFNTATQGYLRSQDLNPCDFQQFYGTALQQVLHGEICELFEQVAEQVRTMPYPSQLLYNATNFADGAHDVNSLEFVRLTGALLDVAWQYVVLPNLMYVEYSGAVLSGGFYSVVDFVYMSRHPLETGKALGKALWCAAETFSLMQMHATYPEEVAPLLKERSELIGAGISTFATGFQESSGPKKIETLSKFGAGFYIPGKILHAFGAACGVLGKQARVGRTLEGAASMLVEDLGVAEILDEAAQAAHQLELATQEATIKYALTELMEAEGQVSKTIPLTMTLYEEMSFVEILNELQANDMLLGNSQFQKLVLKHFYQQFYKQDLIDFSKTAKAVFNKVNVLHKGKEAEMICNVEHMMSYNLIFKKNIETGIVEGFISGGHVGIKSKNLQDAKLIMLLTEESLPGGARAVEYSHVFGKNIAKKTEYPWLWSGEQIMQANIEAFHHPIYVHNFLVGNKQCIRMVGVSKTGLKIDLIITEHASGQLTLKTAYPYWEKRSGLNL